MILEIDNIDTFYGDTQVLFDVSMNVAEGETVALLGQNGSGRTTLLRSILGLTSPRTGKIQFDGIDITAKMTHEIARMGIGWVPDDRRIFPTLTVARNLSIARKSTKYRSWSLSEIFEIFSAVEYLMERECENLSGGEMQMVAISRALLGAPGLVLFDEPTQGLAPKIVQDVMMVISRLREVGISALIVEQNTSTALEICDRGYLLHRGKIVHQASASDLLRDERLYTD